MITAAKWFMRVCALCLIALALWAVHGMTRDYSSLWTIPAFAVLWVVVAVALLLLLGSAVVTKDAAGRMRAGKEKPPSQEEIEALRNKLRGMCIVRGCNHARIAGLEVCSDHIGTTQAGVER